LAANIPLVESGTAGYLGQVTVIRKVNVTILTKVVDPEKKIEQRKEEI
jgi:hypothetical protein